MSARRRCEDCGHPANQHESGVSCYQDEQQRIAASREDDRNAKDAADALKTDLHLDDRRGANQ